MLYSERPLAAPVGAQQPRHAMMAAVDASGAGMATVQDDLMTGRKFWVYGTNEACHDPYRPYTFLIWRSPT